MLVTQKMKAFKWRDKVFRSRILVTISGILLIEIILLNQFFTLQVKEQELYQVMSEDNHLRYAPVSPNRGLIVDRNGSVLARNRTQYHLEVTSILVEDMDSMLRELHTIIPLNGQEIDDFKQHTMHKNYFFSFRLKSGLSDLEVAQFAVNQHRFFGVEVVGDLAREYPYAEAFSHIVGYLGKPDQKTFQQVAGARSYISSVGKSGLEKLHEQNLRGKLGFRKVEVNARGRVLRTVSEQKPVAGKNVMLALDKDLQTIAYDALGDYEGAVVAMDPRNGDILAMVSKPAFNPNQFIRGMSGEAYKRLEGSGKEIFFNRALSGQYPPGSTIKPVIALAGLSHEVTSEDDYMFAGPHYSVPGHERKFKDWKKEGHGWVNLRSAIVQSCDVFFYDLSYRLGIDRLSEFFKVFGLGQLSGIDMQHEMPGVVPSRQWKREQYNHPWYPEETVITGIGQGYLLATPLQLSMMTATIANRGIRVQPRLVKAIWNKDNQAWKTKPATTIGEVEINAQHWDYVIDSMIDTVNRPNGTAYRIGRSAPYTIAGKTGTAQVYGLARDAEYEHEKIDKHLRDHALFIGFAPAKNPTIAIAVIVEHAGGGAKYAAPIARLVFDAHFNVTETASVP